MAIASGMKDLTQEIASSQDERTKRLGEIKEEAKQVRGEAHDLIKGFQVSRKEAGAQQRENLAEDKAARESDVGQMRGDFRQDQEELRAELKEASAAWRELRSAKAKNKERRTEKWESQQE